MTPEERTRLINQLVVLAKENMIPEIKESVDQAQLQNALDQMAGNVIEQIISLNDNERLIVAMATITKLLVENFILQQAKNNI